MVGKFCFSLVLLIVCVSCAHQPASTAIDAVKASDMGAAREERRHQMVGRWLGEAPTKDGKTERWLMERRLDGTFTVMFQILDKQKKVFEQTETGYWGIVGDIYFSLTREILHGDKFDPQDVTKATYYDAYKILNFDANTLHYKDLDFGNEYTIHKVPKDYKLN